MSASVQQGQDLFLVGGTALTMNRRLAQIPDAVVGIRNGKIFCLESNPSFKAPSGARVLDCKNTLLLPGLINGHTHVGMTLLRGRAEDLPLHDWLNKVVFPAERRWGSPEFAAFGAKLAAAEMIRAGTTTLNDMYYFEDAVAKALHEAGLRAICGQTIVEISRVQICEDLYRDLDAYLEAVMDYPLITPAIAPHSVYGVSEETWKALICYATERGLRVHLHLSESEDEVEECRRRTGKTPPAYCQSLGLWDLRTICAHAVVLSDDDIDIMRKQPVGIVHNPESNLKLANGICKVKRLRAEGMAVGLGTDGSASNNDLDLLREIDTAAKMQAFQSGVGALKAADAVGLLTREGARALHLEEVIGSLEEGKAGDVVALDLHRPHATPLYDPYAHVVYGSSGADVRHTVVAGKVLMENRKLITIDEEALLEEARAWGARIGQADLAPSAGSHSEHL